MPFVCNRDNVTVALGDETIEEINFVELLGIKIDTNLNFNEHVADLCKKGNQKLHALPRISKYLNEDRLHF